MRSLSSSSMRRGVARGGYLLLEMMIGVAIFSIGVLVLADCLNNCLDAEAYRRMDYLARGALSARMAEIRAAAVAVDESPVEDRLEGRFAGITLHQHRSVLERTNEEGVMMDNLYTVHLRAAWQTPEGEYSREIDFYQSE